MAQKWPKITQNSPKMTQNCPNWPKNYPKLPKWPKNDLKWPKNLHQLKKIAQIYLPLFNISATIIMFMFIKMILQSEKQEDNLCPPDRLARSVCRAHLFPTLVHFYPLGVKNKTNKKQDDDLTSMVSHSAMGERQWWDQCLVSGHWWTHCSLPVSSFDGVQFLPGRRREEMRIFWKPVCSHRRS